MGILFSKIKTIQKNKPNTYHGITSYSWDKNKNDLSLDNYVIENINDVEKWKLSSSVNGQQFIVRNCLRSTIFILDFMNTVIIDECDNCTFIFGPIKRSLFIRECVNCTFIGACEQFRLRDCKNLKISLYCATQPIIESSKDIKFSCFQLYYENIQEHFQKCNLNIWNNIWYKIHDYTPANKDDHPNWNFDISNEIQLTSPSLTSPSLEIKQLNLSTSKDNSLIPLTYGLINKINDTCENCLVVFCDEYSAKTFLKLIRLLQDDIMLIKSRQIDLTTQHAESLFLTTTLINAVRHGSVIGLHFYGKNSIQVCTQIIIKNSDTIVYYVSPNSNMASHQVNTFFSIADLKIECFS